MRAATRGPWFETQLLDAIATTEIIEQRPSVVVAGRIQPIEAVAPLERRFEARNPVTREQRRHYGGLSRKRFADRTNHGRAAVLDLAGRRDLAKGQRQS